MADFSEKPINGTTEQLESLLAGNAYRDQKMNGYSILGVGSLGMQAADSEDAKDSYNIVPSKSQKNSDGSVEYGVMKFSTSQEGANTVLRGVESGVQDDDAATVAQLKEVEKNSSGKNSVKYTAQELTEEEQSQARANIGAARGHGDAVYVGNDREETEVAIYGEQPERYESGYIKSGRVDFFATNNDQPVILGHIADGINDHDAATVGQLRNIAVSSGDGLSPKYDLKDGYAYTEGIYIAKDGTETALAGKNYKCVDYIPILGGVSYTMYGVGYALYNNDKVFLYAVIDETGTNRICEFTPTTGGYVRLTINSSDISYARFCRTSEKYREIWEYEPDVSPFFNPRIPCDVHLYGDSNSEGYGLTDTSKAWSNRLGALITSLPTKIYNYRFLCFADKGESRYPILNADGYCRFTAYTHFFEVSAANVGEIAVHIDGQAVESLTSDNSTNNYAVTEGLHTVELFGVSGENRITGIVSGKNRSFTNHAVFGYASTNLPATPEGSIVIVMFGTNDRMLYPGQPHTMLWNFRKACVDRGVIPYFFTPIPTDTTGEKSEYYKQEISGVISELPPECINIYEDLQLVEVLTGETIFGDALHLNERGHALLYAIAASKLQLAALSSEIAELVKPEVGGSERNYELIETITLTEETTLIERTQEPDGTPYNFKDVFIEVRKGNKEVKDQWIIWKFWYGTKTCEIFRNFTIFTGNISLVRTVSDGNLRYAEILPSTTNAGNAAMGYQNCLNYVFTNENITKLTAQHQSAMPIGTVINIYAVRG